MIENGDKKEIRKIEKRKSIPEESITGSVFIAGRIDPEVLRILLENQKK
jgi:hypothetical protein